MDVLKKEGVDITSLSLEKRQALLNSKYTEELSTVIELNNNGSLSQETKKCKKKINLFWRNIIVVIFFCLMAQSVGMNKEKGELRSITTTKALLCHRKGSRFHYSDSIMLEVPINGTYKGISDSPVPNGVSLRDWNKDTREQLLVKKFIELGGSSEGCVVLSGTPIVTTFRRIPQSFYTTRLEVASVQMNNAPISIIYETDSSSLPKILCLISLFFVFLWSFDYLSSRKKLKQLVFFQSLLKIEL